MGQRSLVQSAELLALMVGGWTSPALEQSKPLTAATQGSSYVPEHAPLRSEMYERFVHKLSGDAQGNTLAPSRSDWYPGRPTKTKETLSGKINDDVYFSNAVAPRVTAALTPGPQSPTAQSSASQVPALNGIAHVAIRVHDLAAAEVFYNQLGFIRAFQLSRNGAPYEVFIKINDRQFIELYSATEKEPQIGFLHLCFEGADLNAIHDDYVSRGLIPISVRKAGAGNLLFTMPGPQQPAFTQNLEYTQYMPGSLHGNDIGKHLGPNRVADRLVSVSLAMVDPEAARSFYVDKLHFLPTLEHALLALPGPSGQTIEIVSPELGMKASFTLATGNLKQASRRIKQGGIAAKKLAHGMGIADPDGNLIVISDQGSVGK